MHEFGPISKDNKMIAVCKINKGSLIFPYCYLLISICSCDNPHIDLLGGFNYFAIADVFPFPKVVK